MHKEIKLNWSWLFHKGDIDVPYPADKGPIYAQSKTERKLIGPAAYAYFDQPDAYFRKDTELRSDGWVRVNLPHDYIIDQTPHREANNATGYFDYDNAWYRRHFTLGEEYRGKRVTLQFEGIAGKATVYLNGCLMRHNYSTYQSFEIDISNNVYFDRENVIAIYVLGTEFEGWWYQGAGIYRDVNLVVTDPVAIDLYGVYAPATKSEGDNWSVDFETTVVNDLYTPITAKAQSKILDADGNEVACAEGEVQIDYREKGTAKYSANVKAPHLWDTEDPYLYTVKTTLYYGGEAVDENSVKIGFRTVEISPETGMLLNGKPTVIKGVCCHQDFGLTGLAVPQNVAEYKVRLIKEMGANGFRCSHYQNSTDIMDALDKYGFIVMAETRWFETSDEAIEQLTTLIKRDRNRPSVVFWSTGNEEHSHITDVGQRIHKATRAVIEKLDKTRFIMSAQADIPTESTIYDDCDIIGINYHLEDYDKIHEMYPEKALFASECCATGTTRGWYLKPSIDGRIQDKDRDTSSWFKGRELTWKFFMERKFIIGGYQWDAIEHRGEAMWPTLCSKSGAIDLFLQKKGAFWQNKSHWTEEPMVHIVPHWNFKGLEGKPIDVTVYTNCDELELFLNDESLGRKAIEKYGHGEWEIPYIPGEIKVIGYREGAVAAEDSRVTTKAPARLRLTQDLTFRSNAEDIGLFTCECLDEDDRVVEDASPFVKFYVNEGARIIGTGSDNCDHNRVTLNERKMYAGKITIGVKAWGDIKTLHLYAVNDDLGMAELTVDFE